MSERVKRTIEAPRDEPTEEMVRAGHLAWDRKFAPGPFTLERIYRAMIAEKDTR